MSDRLTEKESRLAHLEEAIAIFRASMEEFARLAADASQIAADRDRYHDLARRLARSERARREFVVWIQSDDRVTTEKVRDWVTRMIGAENAISNDEIAALLGDNGA
jgi:hypothetical protein